MLDTLFHALVRWLAPVLVFTAEEVWRTRFPDARVGPSERMAATIRRGATRRSARAGSGCGRCAGLATLAIEPARKAKALGSSLEADLLLTARAGGGGADRDRSTSPNWRSSPASTVATDPALPAGALVTRDADRPAPLRPLPPPPARRRAGDRRCAAAAPGARRCVPVKRLGYAIAVVVFVLDQLAKYWVTSRPRPAGARRRPGRRRLRPDVGRATPACRWACSAPTRRCRRWLLVAVTLAIAGGVAGGSPARRSRIDAVALGLVLGGALGNIVDRVRFGYVVDFSTFWRDHHFYVFNVADAAISVGVALLLLRSAVRVRRPKPV